MVKFLALVFFALNVLSVGKAETATRKETDGLIENLLQKNFEWAAKVKSESPDFLRALHKKQTPKILWIGCSDSRVPESRIFESEPGEFFVHRNIANIIRKNDLDLNSVVEYAVDHLHVEHVIICGRYHCGGVQAAMSKLDKSYVSEWIQPISKLYLEKDIEKAWKYLVRKNVHLSAKVLSELPAVKKAKSNPDVNLTIHPWVYDTKTGLVDILKDPSVHIENSSWGTPQQRRHRNRMKN